MLLLFMIVFSTFHQAFHAQKFLFFCCYNFSFYSHYCFDVKLDNMRLKVGFSYK